MREPEKRGDPCRCHKNKKIPAFPRVEKKSIVTGSEKGAVVERKFLTDSSVLLILKAESSLQAVKIVA